MRQKRKGGGLQKAEYDDSYKITIFIPVDIMNI